MKCGVGRLDNFRFVIKDRGMKLLVEFERRGVRTHRVILTWKFTMAIEMAWRWVESRKEEDDEDWEIVSFRRLRNLEELQDRLRLHLELTEDFIPGGQLLDEE